LLALFWSSHNPQRNSGSRQYINAVFYRDETQQKLAESSRDAQGASVATEILPVKEFTYAEDYHQKYYLTRYAEIRQFLTDTYPEGKTLADSTVATRFNAFIGSGMKRDWKTFLAELSSYGLPEAIEQSLRRTAESQV